VDEAAHRPFPRPLREGGGEQRDGATRETRDWTEQTGSEISPRTFSPRQRQVRARKPPAIRGGFLFAGHDDAHSETVWASPWHVIEVGDIYFGKMTRFIKSCLACLAAALLTFTIGVSVGVLVEEIIPPIWEEYLLLMEGDQKCDQ
jgi:hypothetical protein